MVKDQQRHLQCLIPCGGSSTRLGLSRNKCLVKVGKKTILARVVDFWRKYGIEDFIFIVGGDSKEEVIANVKQLKLRTPPTFIDRQSVVNLAGAVLLAKPYIQRRFVLALGDCLNIGEFIVPPVNMAFGVGVCIADKRELRKNYLVEANSHGVSRVVEKPRGEVGLCGMGTLFLDKRVFDYIERLRLPPQATSVDLTGTIQLAIGVGEKVKPVWFMGTYINVTYPEDIKRAEEILREVEIGQA